MLELPIIGKRCIFCVVKLWSIITVNSIRYSIAGKVLLSLIDDVGCRIV
jgi:hypothetical protein